MSKKFATVLMIAGLALVGAGIAGLLTGCAPTVAPQTGSISLALAPTDGMKTILPGEGTTVVSFHIVVSGGPTSVLAIDTSETTVTVGDLLPGTYHFAIDGENSAGRVVGSGTGDAAVIIGSITQCQITISEDLTGVGTLTGTVGYEPNVVTSPIITGQIKNQAGVYTDLEYSLNFSQCLATQTSATFSPGYFTMIQKLWDHGQLGDVLVSGGAFAVRIAKNQTSNYATFYHVSAATGDVQLDLTLDFEDPLALTFNLPSAPAGRIQKYTNDAAFSITLTDAGTTDATTCLWYKSGTPIVGSLDQPSITVNPAVLGGGNYTYSCVVFTTDGKHGGSAQFDVAVLDVDPAQLSMSGAVDRHDYPPSSVVSVGLFDAAMDDTPIMVTQTDAYGNYSLSLAPTGTYYLMAWYDANGNGVFDPTEHTGDKIWWTPTGSTKTRPASANLTIPHDAGMTFNFGRLGG